MREDFSRSIVEQKDIKEIDLKQYYYLIKKRLWIIVLITMVTTSIGYFYSTSTYTALYESSRRVILGSGSEDMNTLMVMMKDPIIMEKVSSELQLERPSEALANQITVTRLDESQVVHISVIDTNLELAARIANVTAVIYQSEMENILGFTDVQLLSEAKVNPNPMNESTNRVTIIAFIFGLATGIGFVFLLDSLDMKLRKESQVEAILGVPILGTISNMNKKKYTTASKKQNEIRVGGEKVGVKQNA
ncbi:capsular biosynthesis protein [Oceanobacillus piezotolerans]|uniref:Capsular biosynthesis protein n=1 Tax=Oceanobacillus piezotolerans TaxID=2448030 RepID=A0A498D3J6_9BACI|nr:Wzz/FepE/Etk N-terminal domain-containing protein [Oceanobacillus piezotolerans]RLL42752.1 capsular biosynthesis protein [Oceanobacillus piezotolerans]